MYKCSQPAILCPINFFLKDKNTVGLYGNYAASASPTTTDKCES